MLRLWRNLCQLQIPRAVSFSKDKGRKGTPMKSVSSDRIYLWSKRLGAVLLIAMAIVAAGNAQRFSAGEKGKVKRQVVPRTGDRVKVQDSKTSDFLAGR
jgi:hypothetical protein